MFINKNIVLYILIYFLGVLNFSGIVGELYEKILVLWVVIDLII